MRLYILDFLRPLNVRPLGGGGGNFPSLYSLLVASCVSPGCRNVTVIFFFLKYILEAKQYGNSHLRDVEKIIKIMYVKCPSKLLFSGL